LANGHDGVAVADESDPPRKFYKLKRREFEAVNDVPPPLPPPLLKLTPPQPGGKIDVHDLFQAAGTPGPVLPAGPRHTPKNEVHVILHDNLARANAAGLNELLLLPKRRSRRTRDFMIVVLPLDAFFAFIAFGPYSTVNLMAYGVAGIIIVTIGLAWVMFCVMDDY
jgi:hypothetical protein